METAASESPILTAAEVGKLIGLHESQVRRWAAAKIIPHYKSGTHIVFHRAEVERWMQQGSEPEAAPQIVKLSVPAANVMPLDLNKLIADGIVDLMIVPRKRSQ